jgi:hypothetical protein
MPTSIPLRSVAPTGAHSANANPWLESPPHHRDARRNLLSHPDDASLTEPTELTGTPFRAQSTASAHHKQLSIPIPSPR